MPKSQPPGWHTLTPRIVVADPHNLATFLRTVFRARGDIHSDRPAEIRIGDSVLLLSDGGGARDPIPAFLYVYVEDTDATYQRAISAGALSLEPPGNMPYGDRRAMIKDPWGNLWQIATHHP